VCGVILSGLATPMSASAQSVGPSHELALPRSVFPAAATVRGGPASNQAANRTSALHTVPLDRAGRLSGYIQTAQWLAAPRRRNENRVLGVQYVASIFSSSDLALIAMGDARASLWELGRPVRISGLGVTSFEVDERDGHRNVYVLLQSGPVASEIRLRFADSLDPGSVAWGEWYLGRIVPHAESIAQRVAGQIAAGTTPPETPLAPASPPPPYVAPWGTGPVVKSPSLMVLSALSQAQSEQLGTYRPDARPRLASRVTLSANLIPAAPLSRYVRTASTSPQVGWYSAATLYADAASARDAWSSLVHSNGAKRRLRRYDVPVSSGSPETDDWRGWRDQDEMVLLVRTQNVVIVLATTGQAPSDVVNLAALQLDTVPTWLHGEGTHIVNARGVPVRLAYLNWYGAESPDFIVGGLDFQSYRAILQQIAQLGYNGVRLPFSNELIERNPVVSAHVGANPDLVGLHALDILDRVVAYAGALGLSVVLDNHRSDAGWSSQESGLWYTPDYPDTSWVADWATVASRYAVNNVVVGVDLRNEPHGPATWGDGNPATDWRLAAQRAGDAALAINSRLLVMVEGVQFYGGSGSYWWGGNLLGVASAPIALQLPDGTSAHSQLIYSPHDYGPDNCHGGCPWFNPSTTPQTLVATWNHFWGYVNSDPAAPYAAPLWVGEFGTCNLNDQCVSDTAPGSQGQWFSALVQYIADRGLSWAYWSVNGTESTGATRVYGALDFYGVFQRDWLQPIEWLHAALASIQDHPPDTP